MMPQGFEKPVVLFNGSPIGFCEETQIEYEKIGPNHSENGISCIVESGEVFIDIGDTFRLLMAIDKKSAWRLFQNKWSDECRKIKRRLRQ